MNCPHGINIKHKRCYLCEDIAAAELQALIARDCKGLKKKYGFKIIKPKK